MNSLPSIEPPEDFERNVHVRSLLSTLPSVPPPQSFEGSVLRAAHRSGVKISLLIATIGAIGLAVGGWWFTVQPDNVAVRVPVVVAPTAVVAPPAPIVVAPVLTKPAIKKKRVARKPHGVAGH